MTTSGYSTRKSAVRRNGTAKGSLTKGKLKGEALVDKTDKPSTFTFSGKFKDGKFSGTHAQIDKEGESHATGTLTLGR